MKSDKHPIQVEDLLRLKRAERPPAEFWTQFDRELRAKQLSALVARRPWWHLPRASLAVFSRYHLPLGAAAVLGVTFISVRQFSTTSSRLADGAMVVRSPALAAPAVIASVDSVSGRGEIAPQNFAHEVSFAATDGTRAEAPTARALVAAEAVLTDEPARLSLLAATLPERSTPEKSAGFGYMGASLMSASAGESNLARGLLVGASTGFEARALPARGAVEPLQQMTPPAERSRAKLLTAMLSMTSSDAPARTNERVADRISEERLYDQVHRFGARGAGVSMKF